MSKKGCKRNLEWTKEEDDYLRNNSNKKVKELANELHRSEASIRNRKYKLGVYRGNCVPFSEEEKQLIKDWYTKDDYGVDLESLSKIMNRCKTSISAQAKQMGLTKYGNFTKEQRETRGNQIREIITSIEHPRGMLGKHHTEETKHRMSIASTINAANMTQEEKHNIAMKALETKKKNGTFPTTTSNSYSRTKSGIRKDLGQYFRSAWEANVARIFDYEDIKWEYEYKRFYFEETVDGVSSYEPDFYLPEFNKWVEVKGWMDDKSKTRLRLFEEQYPEEYNNLILIDNDFYLDLRQEFFYLDNWEDNSTYLKGRRKCV